VAEWLKNARSIATGVKTSLIVISEGSLDPAEYLFDRDKATTLDREEYLIYRDRREDRERSITAALIPC
jgi:hypothetical protein